MTQCGDIDMMEPSQYLDQCGLISKGVQWHSSVKWTIAQEMLVDVFRNTWPEIKLLKSLTYLPGGNELFFPHEDSDGIANDNWRSVSWINILNRWQAKPVRSQLAGVFVSLEHYESQLSLSAVVGNYQTWNIIQGRWLQPSQWPDDDHLQQFQVLKKLASLWIFLRTMATVTSLTPSIPATLTARGGWWSQVRITSQQCGLISL